MIRQQALGGESTSSLWMGGRYLKEQCLHQQGAIQTWQGKELSTLATVVVKTAPLHSLQVGAFDRMLREDAVLRDLRSPWLAPPRDCGLEGELLFRVTPWVSAGTLSERLAKGPLSIPEALVLGRGLLRALREAHAHGVLHRHLKPSNVAFLPGKSFQEVLLIDFGLALEDLREHSLLALPRSAIQYLSPEQLGLVSADVGPASDLYAVGMMLFECLTGTPPFRAEPLGELLRQHLRTVPELRAQGLLVPRALEQVVQHLLREDPRERYQSAEAALSDLEAIASALERGLAEPVVVVGRSDRHQALTEPTFIGRAAEVEELERALGEATRGQGSLVLVEGQSGGGKTMLLDELARRGLAQGARVLRGQGFDRTAPEPLQLLRGVLRDLESAVKRTPELARTVRSYFREQLGICSPEFSRLVEMLGMAPPLHACAEEYLDLAKTVSPQLAEELEAPVPTSLEFESLGEARVARALTAVLEVLGDAETPALVLLDDCQWSDELTLKLLEAWARPSEDAPGAQRFVTVVVAFRTEEVPEAHLLRRLPSTHHVCLAPWGASDVRDLAESMAGRIPDEALDLVVRLSEGNPFMTAAMVRGLVECGALKSTASGWHVEPERLAEVSSSRRAASLLLRRLELFSEETRSLMVAGAILGREFEVGLAAVLARQSPEQAVVALEEARRRHFLWTETSTGRYTFAHDRIREALLERLPAEEARALHLMAAQELERRAPERTFELAWHFEAAGELERAGPQALKSAEAARARYALDLAERYYRLADRGMLDADAATRMALLEGLGDVLLFRGKHEEAERNYRRAQAFAVTRLDQARLEERRGEAMFGKLDLPAASSRMERALRLIGWKVPGSSLSRVVFLLWEVFLYALRPLRLKRQARRAPLPDGQAQLAVRLYMWLLQVYWLQGDSVLAAAWMHLRGWRLVERYAPHRALSMGYTNHGAGLVLFMQAIPRMPSFLAGFTLARARKYLQKALALQEDFGDVLNQAHTLSAYQYCLLSCARYEESAELGRRAAQRFRQAGANEGGAADDAKNNLGLALYLMGDLSGAAELGQRMYRRARESGDAFRRGLALDLWACASEGQLPGEVIAAELVARVEPDAGHVFARHALLLHAEGVRLLRAGQPGQAVIIFEQAVQHAKKSKLRVPLRMFLGWSQLVTALREQAAQVPSEAFSLRVALLRRAKATARRLIRHTLPFRENRVLPLRELGLIAAMEGKNALARRYFARSLAGAERLGMRYERARTLLARAKVGAALGWPDAAQDAAAAEEALRPMRAALEPATVPQAPASLSLVDRFPRILEAGRAIASALTREAVLAAVREAAFGLLRGESCGIVEATSEELSGEARWPFMQRARELRRPVVPSTEELESTGHGAERSALGAPILVRGQVAVLFYVTTHKLAGAFGPEELRIAEYIATLAGAALENAQGFAEVTALSEERERLYQQAQTALRKRDEFLAVASHELRTPFTPMRLYMQGLLNALRNPAKAAGLEPWVAKLETANTRLQRLARLVEELFDVSRLSYDKLPLRRGEVDLSLLAAEAGERWQEELARVRCTYTLKAPAPVVGQWDGMRLEQVIDNLLSNAMKFGPGQPIHLTVTKGSGCARLTVRDFGKGIAPEDQGRIFERFERAVSEENYGGFGLGLWIAREVVQAHGGHLSVESAPGQGATFTVELPL
ncbi:ATP-binding protein [Hyalangium sp.]|uniref:ATP-binding protein n=1 Tax=Hyalangium sp. TaxID=2028555 RepID=UPI002D6BFDAB|nr:ATP-binding protein [Hyalangium sp.]HYH97046.1 ATP-binding protein [Hyalangium sp.]